MRINPCNPHILPVLVGLTMLTGCQSIQLENHTIRQAKTLTDLQYKLVLDNLALLACNPSGMPFYSAAGTGLTNISQQAQANFSPSIDLLLNPAKTVYKYYGDKWGFGGTAQQTNLEQWTTASVLNPDELKIMRSVYQRALGYPVAQPNEWDKKLQEFFKNQPEMLEAMRPGWLCIGRPGQKPPKDAAYTGRYADHHVWVMGSGVEYLSRITLAILDIATAIPTSATSNKIGDPSGKLTSLQNRAKDLAYVYGLYPDKTSAIAKETKAQLDGTLINIIAIQNHEPVDEVRKRVGAKFDTKNAIEMLENTWRRGAAESEADAINHAVAAAQRQENAIPIFQPTPEPEPTSTSPFTRGRVNLYNPNIIPISAGFP